MLYKLITLFLFTTLLVLVAGCAVESERLSEIDASADPRVEDALGEKAVLSTLIPPEAPLTPTPTQVSLTPSPTLTVSEFMITSKLCDDGDGPDCTKLRLGDDYLTISMPAKGYLYSCSGKNPNAPGAIESKITWINFADKTWNFLQKLWLPQGTFGLEIGTYAETLSDHNRHININNLPVDGKIGDWPMTNYPILTDIDRNPGIPASRGFSYSYPANPSVSTSPSCVSLGAIGVTTNGVVIYNAADGRGEDAVAREIVDVFGGHPAMSDYHYHFIPERLDNESLSDGHSDIVGYINDGFPIYGYKGEGGLEMSNDDLDLCHGHEHGALGYHYHATLEYPYTVGCYMGIPISSSLDGGLGHGGQGNNPPPKAQNEGPDLAKAASILGVTENTLRNSLGPPPPDLIATAESLGISEQSLREALGLNQ